MKKFTSNKFGGMCATAKSGCSEDFHFKPALTYKLEITWE